MYVCKLQTNNQASPPARRHQHRFQRPASIRIFLPSLAHVPSHWFRTHRHMTCLRCRRECASRVGNRNSTKYPCMKSKSRQSRLVFILVSTRLLIPFSSFPSPVHGIKRSSFQLGYRPKECLRSCSSPTTCPVYNSSFACWNDSLTASVAWLAALPTFSPTDDAASFASLARLSALAAAVA